MGKRSGTIGGGAFISRGLILAPVLVAFCASVFPAHAESDWKVYRGDYFAVKLPPGFEVKKTRPVQDFEIFAITSAGTTYASIYIGDQPTFPSLKRDGQTESTTFKSKDLEMVSVWKDVQLLGREILVNLNRSEHGPSCLHIWTEALPPEKLRIAEKIVSSVMIAP